MVVARPCASVVARRVLSDPAFTLNCTTTPWTGLPRESVTALTTRIAFDETPPAGAWPAAFLIVAGVVVVLRADQDAESDLVDPGGLLT